MKETLNSIYLVCNDSFGTVVHKDHVLLVKMVLTYTDSHAISFVSL